MNRKKNILIVGSIPPPIGGVTIHVKRLLFSLKREQLNHEFFSLKENSKIKLILKLLKFKSIHLHTSNVNLRCLVAVFCFVLRKKLVITWHGNLGRYGKLKNQLDYFAVRLTRYPVILNEQSLIKGKGLNKRIQKITAFIPPADISLLSDEIQKKVDEFVSRFDIIHTTNAFDISFDSEGREVYSISDLIHVFNQQAEIGLIFSDPSGNYIDFLKDKNVPIPENVLVISEPHDYINILKKADVFIRATTTDGDSLSVKEALFFGKKVIASDCVERNKACVLYQTGNVEELKHLIGQNVQNENAENNIEDGSKELIKLYKSL